MKPLVPPRYDRALLAASQGSALMTRRAQARHPLLYRTCWSLP